MSQPTQPPIEHRSVIFTTVEIQVLTDFINAGMKANVAALGLCVESSNTIQNALHLAKKLQDATPVQKLHVCPQSPDITDPVKS